MKIVVSDQAFEWFKDEVGLETGDAVQFYSQIYGSSPVQEKFSLAFTVNNELTDVAAKTEKDGLSFFVKDNDVWFFDGHDLYIEYNQEHEEIEYKYIKP
ncbi:uncharacterized protein YneR [Pullulanibacillus pueri]|uniref:HesB/YadR/YfhF family protein n=1 Tax=Pullulanibacillus pueri TaxID=1437324 RepID=A0A8J2ZVM5_9BACL|nr:HesB/YadR/YfhF family protein [Pullulanibacillus pueri]MBM7682297.1 uncharacterized protein YneR [Pullulanibacillus pueri]GGH80898.1 hypothetical protein GCM10007096_17990 [Pullulanibacillus pueri]